MKQAVITADVIKSQSDKNRKWMSELKSVLEEYGNEPQDWDIYRGDSFQLSLPSESALKAAIVIKAAIKKVKNIDVRIAIGIGEIEYRAETVTESNGTAFVRSGKCFDSLKKTRMAINSGHQEWDEEMNLYLKLASLTMNQWREVTASDMKEALLTPELNQSDLAEKLNKSQSTLSENLIRGGYDEITYLLQRYEKIVKRLW